MTPITRIDERHFMKIAVLGTGMVGRALAGRLSQLGHDVAIGTRDVQTTTTRTDPDGMGTPPYSVWQPLHPGVHLMRLDEAGAGAELVINATSGPAALAALDAVGAANLAGKVVLDLALPLDFSNGMPPRLTIANTDSLGEQVQRTYPQARVVKTLTNVFCEVMVDPARVPGRHNLFMAGNDPSAKASVVSLLQQFGWQREAILDLGGIASARALEMYEPLYFAIQQTLGTFDFNISVNRS